MNDLKNKKIVIIGLGYVGMPLAHAFSKKYSVVGFDTNKDRVNELKNGGDSTLELKKSQVIEALNNNITFTNDLQEIKDSDIYIITVQTPIDDDKKPDLVPLIDASKMVAKVLSKDNIVIYESTVYPGATEEICVPILEKYSGLKFNQDFYCGYSPERINPGDKKHKTTKIVKITSGSTVEIGEKIDDLYKSIIEAGTYLAPSIKVAEASKVIENAQRDINIAFMNELSIIFNHLGINTNEVLKAARTKWNFKDFTPGLVGGHCISVDPYYLIYKAQEAGYKPEVLLSGRKMNEGMGVYVAKQVIKLMIKKGLPLLKSRVLILGITFKENCPDIRNSKVINIINELQDFGCEVDVIDPLANKNQVKDEYGVTLKNNVRYDDYSAVILAVSHNEFKGIKLTNKQQVVFDIKSILDSSDGGL
ncbi:UDP-glucose dehydrogenase [uncultured Candidatus Thioglobus sp.]|nr:UDP-glucose dehydrogenase [uncultured Candidatus Thioglobus sp.]